MWDIETSPNILAKFDLREEYVQHTNILQERFIICAAWKLLGESKTHTVSVLDGGGPLNDDEHVVRTLHKVLSGVDVIVAHNGDDFDTKWLNGRMLAHGLPPRPPVISIDTCKVAKKVFLLNSNRLDYIGKYLHLGGKKSTPGGLWIDVLKGSRKAVREMVAYNKRDVELLEEVFLRLRPFIPDHVNRRLYSDRSGCPRCGSTHVQARGYHKSLTRVYQRLQCQGCGGWFRNTQHEKHLTATARVI